MKLKSIRINADYRISLAYPDGFVGEFDFTPLVDGEGLTSSLENPVLFAQAYLDHGVLTWPNSYDIDPDVLRFWAEQGRICSQEETDAHFAKLYDTDALLA